MVEPQSYADVPLNQRPKLVDRIQEANPKIKREEISAWVNSKTTGSKDKRFLTSEQVGEIKELISRQGRLEFRILANIRDATPSCGHPAKQGVEA